MFISKLEIRGFGKINDLSLNFSRGLNIIFGNNESGKTTIQMFIRAMLFGLRGGRASREGLLPPSKRYKPWRGDDFSGFMEYEFSSGEVYRVGRNFSNNTVRVFDSLFNDITNDFEESKERGALFAEKQLELNDESFDRTVFIKQMETRIGEEGARELLSRMSNVRETGFEDISFKRAQEALREALIHYVGTEKTSTRPLDKVKMRLEELKEIRNQLEVKRNSLLNIEGDLLGLKEEESRLKEELFQVEKAREILGIIVGIEKDRKLRDGLSELLSRIDAAEEEFFVLSAQIEEYNKIKAEIETFTGFGEDEVESLNKDYYNMQSYIIECRKLELEIEKKSEEIESLQVSLQPLTAFGDFEHNIEAYALNLKRSCDDLKTEYDKYRFDVIDDRIKVLELSKGFFKYSAIISGILSAVFFISAFTNFLIEGYAFGAFSIVVACTLSYFAAKRAKKVADLVREKRVSLYHTNNLNEQINQKQKELVELYRKVNAWSIEEFLQFKVMYDNWAQKLAELNEGLFKLEEQFLMGMRKIESLKREILKTLVTTKVISNEEYKSILGQEDYPEIKEEHIKSFIFGVNRYKSLEPIIVYSVKRHEDINRNIETLYSNAADFCGIDISTREPIIEEVDAAVTRLAAREESLKQYADFDLSFLTEGMESAKLETVYKQLEEDSQGLMQELNTVMLKVRELETILKTSLDDERLQKVYEEIEELEARKLELEDINISLKTALDVLTEASEEIQRDFAPILNDKMSTTIKQLTGGRYEDLRADDNLTLRTIAPETGDVVTSTILSGGTIDQMYLALRISMAEIVTSSTEKLPFIMDEILAQYDDGRTKQALKFFEELAAQRQIILFTCKGRELEIAKEVCGQGLNVIELE